MGAPDTEPGYSSNEVQHQVTLTRSFLMKQTEVTQDEWVAVMGSNPSYFTSCGGTCPVEHVSWYAAVAWEYAVRAGTTTAFHTGPVTVADPLTCNLDTNLDAAGWYCGNSLDTTHPAEQKQANGWGLYDVHGNVWEWTWDWYDAYGGDVTDPVGPTTGTPRVIRGGSWAYSTDICRSANRASNWPADEYNDFGFRPSRSIP